MPRNKLTRFTLNLISKNQLKMLQFSFCHPDHEAKYPPSVSHPLCNSVVSAFRTVTISHVTVFPLLN
ncbi:hypothetical protein BT93_K0716 [Corymbia citriodora subsp. variegata]|nr:hypothetical protein BT93_K0716 [Corymbia citriodora subsp. variegata]